LLLFCRNSSLNEKEKGRKTKENVKKEVGDITMLPSSEERMKQQGLQEHALLLVPLYTTTIHYHCTLSLIIHS